MNGATCTDGVDSYICNCVAGYEGKLCQVNIDDCSPNPCQNGGTCIDGIDSYSCNCAAGYEGDLCNISTGVWVRYPGPDFNSAYEAALPYRVLLQVCAPTKSRIKT